MTIFLKRVWHTAPVATVILALALAAGVFFGVRTVAFWVYWHDPAHREQAITGWMTPNYISRSWHVPTEVVRDALDVTIPRPGGMMNLTALAENQGVTVDELITTIEEAIAAFRADHPPKAQVKP